MHGKLVKTPRWQQAYGMDYKFTGTINKALPVPVCLHSCHDFSQKNVDTRLNEILLNWYDGALGHFLGQLDQAIRLYDEVSDDGELAVEISKLKASIRECEKRVDRNEIERRKEVAITELSQSSAEFMPLLDNDHHTDSARLIIEDLTLRISGIDGDSYLWNIGSGSNWLSYHLATLLALQRFFLKHPPSPVPGLLVFDQPSQVYFPEKLALLEYGRRKNTCQSDLFPRRAGGVP